MNEIEEKKGGPVLRNDFDILVAKKRVGGNTYVLYV